MAKRRHPKPGSGHAYGSGHYTRQIIKCLEKVHTLSGVHAAQVYADWVQLLDACLAALPTHLTALAQTGHLAEDTPETKQLFEQLRVRYQDPCHLTHGFADKCKGMLPIARCKAMLPKAF